MTDYELPLPVLFLFALSVTLAAVGFAHLAGFELHWGSYMLGGFAFSIVKGIDMGFKS